MGLKFKAHEPSENEAGSERGWEPCARKTTGLWLSALECHHANGMRGVGAVFLVGRQCTIFSSLWKWGMQGSTYGSNRKDAIPLGCFSSFTIWIIWGLFFFNFEKFSQDWTDYKMRICLKLCQTENLAELDVLFFKLYALSLETDLPPPNQPSLSRKQTQMLPFLKEFKSFFHRN